MFILATRAEVRLTLYFGSGSARQRRCGRRSREGGFEVTAREQQAWRVKHDSGEGEMERVDMRMQHTFFMRPWAMRVFRSKKTSLIASMAKKHTTDPAACAFTQPPAGCESIPGSKLSFTSDANMSSVRDSRQPKFLIICVQIHQAQNCVHTWW